jgi:2-desacetyl-2-hydroxyethyl bacteriochlorophyllide A dehydrogenase
MKQAVMIAPGNIIFQEIEKPSPKANEVLILIQRIGICGSDIHVKHGQHPYTSYPVVQGHEFSGEIAEIGAGVAGIQIGDRVTALPQIVCGQCPPCLRGYYHICDHLKVQGFQAPGCAQEFFLVPIDKLVKLPDSFTFEQGAMVEPAAVAVHAVTRAGKLAGVNVVVVGAGPIGNLVAQVAQANGAHVLVTDLSDFRLGIARECGLMNVSNANKEPLPEAVHRVFGATGFTTAFECVGVETTLGAIIDNIGKGGTVVVVGVFSEKPRIDAGLIQDRELMLLGTLMYQRQDYDRAIALMSDGSITTAPLMTAHFPFENYADAYEFIDKNRETSMKVFIDVAV